MTNSKQKNTLPEVSYALFVISLIFCFKLKNVWPGIQEAKKKSQLIIKIKQYVAINFLTFEYLSINY